MVDKLRLRISLIFVTVLIAVSGIQAQQLKLQQTETMNDQRLLTNPRRALHTFLYWQQPGHKRPDLVTKTMALAQNTSSSKKYELADKLRMVLDSKGLVVNYDKIPSNPAYVDSLSGLHQYMPFATLPEVYLVRKDSVWVFSEATINRIPGLYRATFSVFVDVVLDNLPPFMRYEWVGLQVWQYVAIFLWLILGLVVRKLFEYVLENYASKLVGKTKSIWDDRLVATIQKPAGFTFLMFLYWITYTNLHLSVDINYYLFTIFEVGVSIGIIWLLYNLSNILSDYLGQLTSKTESKLDDQLVPLIRKSMKIFIVIIGVLFVLQNHGINVASLLAGLGLGGLAFALAARDTLANFFGSITIFLDKPFQVGDWVKTNNVEGTVEEVGFRSTRIRTFYNSLISVPNAKMADAEIDNLGLREYRRLKTILNLTYSTTPEQMEAFVEGIKAIIKANEHFRQDFYEVHFYNFGAHSLDVLVYAFFEVPSWSDELQYKHNFFLEILRLAKEVGVEFAFPTQTLHVDSFYGDEPRKIGQDRSDEDLVSAVQAFGPNGKLAYPDGVKLTKDGEEIDFGASLKRSGS